jgi:hypothetical protein
MKKIIFIIFLLSMITSAFSWERTAQGTILGIVLDRQTKEPVIGAVVYLKNTHISTFTDTAGRFRLPVAFALRDALVTVQVHHLAYDDETWNFQPNHLQVIYLNSKQNLLQPITIIQQRLPIVYMTDPPPISDEEMAAYYRAVARANQDRQDKQDSVAARKLKGWRFWKKIVE